MYEIDRLEQMLKDAGVPCERELRGPFIYLYYPRKDGYGYQDIDESGGMVFAYKDEDDTLLYKGYIFMPDWVLSRMSDKTVAYARQEGGSEFSADDVFPLWWADWLCRQEGKA